MHASILKVNQGPGYLGYCCRIGLKSFLEHLQLELSTCIGEPTTHNPQLIIDMPNISQKSLFEYDNSCDNSCDNNPELELTSKTYLIHRYYFCPGHFSTYRYCQKGFSFLLIFRGKCTTMYQQSWQQKSHLRLFYQKFQHFLFTGCINTPVYQY